MTGAPVRMCNSAGSVVEEAGRPKKSTKTPPVIVSNNVYIANTLNISNNAYIANTLTVGNTAFISNNLTVSNNIIVGNTLSIANNLIVANTITSGNLTVKTINVGNNIYIANNMTVGNTLYVSNNLNIANTITSNLIPGTDTSYFLGNSTNRWNSGYFSGTLDVNNSIYFPGQGSVQSVANLQLITSHGANNYTWNFDTNGLLTFPSGNLIMGTAPFFGNAGLIVQENAPISEIGRAHV